MCSLKDSLNFFMQCFPQEKVCLFSIGSNQMPQWLTLNIRKEYAHLFLVLEISEMFAHLFIFLIKDSISA